MLQIPIQALPNQKFSTRLDDVRYEFTIKETNGVMCFDMARDDIVILSGSRIVGGTPLLPYFYLQSGNFIMLTSGDDLPDYRQFGITQFLLYLSAAEVAAISG